MPGWNIGPESVLRILRRFQLRLFAVFSVGRRRVTEEACLEPRWTTYYFRGMLIGRFTNYKTPRVKDFACHARYRFH